MIFEVHILGACKVAVIYEFETEANTPKEAALKSEKWFKDSWVRVNVKGSYKMIIFKMLSEGKLEQVF